MATGGPCDRWCAVSPVMAWLGIGRNASARPDPGDAAVDELVDGGVDDGRLRVVGVRALGELFQERVHFSLDLDDRFGLGQLGLQPFVLGAEFVRPRAACGAPRPPSEARPSLTTRVPSRCWRRQSVMIEEYRPSRRNRAPLSPDSLQRSYSARIDNLYSGENTRRITRSPLIVSGTATTSDCLHPVESCRPVPGSASQLSNPSPLRSVRHQTCLTDHGHKGDPSRSDRPVRGRTSPTAPR